MILCILKGCVCGGGGGVRARVPSLTSDQACFISGERESRRTPPKDKGKKDRLIAGYPSFAKILEHRSRKLGARSAHLL